MKRHFMKRAPLVCIIIIAFAAIFAACSSGADAAPERAAESAAPAGGETLSADTPGDADPLGDMPARDYGGYEMRFLTIAAGINSTTRFTDEIYAAAEIGEVINDAVFTRNRKIEEKLNIIVTAVPAENITAAASRSILAGDDDFDVMGAYKWDSMNLASQKLLRDWHGIPGLDFTRAWWNRNAYEKLEACGKLPVMSGSILISEIDDTLAMIYNKSIAENTGAGDIYALVQENKWTLDAFAETATRVSADLNGDGELKAGDDLFGYIQDPASMTNNWCFSCDLLKASARTENGELVLDMNVNADRIQTALEKLAAVSKSGCALTGLDLYEGLTYFKENKIFVYAVILRNIELLRDMDFDFGVIPYPMFDEAQGRYLTHVGNASPILGIPITNSSDDERLGNILEAMAAASLCYVTPAYYETALKEKYSRDPGSAVMLDVILESRTYDLGYCASTGSIVSVIAPLIKSGSSDFSSAWAKAEASTTAAMRKYVEKFLE